MSILAEPTVAVVDKYAEKHGTREVAEAYLQVSLLAGGPDHRRQALLPAARRESRFPRNT